MSDEPRSRIVNTWDQLQAAVAAELLPKAHAFAISYTAPARHVVIAGMSIWSPFIKTDPNSAWYAHGRKTFDSNREKGTAEAIAWAADRGYRGPWKRNAMLDWVPAIVQETFPIKRRPK